MLKYVLEENILAKKDADDLFYARPVEVRMYTEEDMAEAIATCNLGISKSEYLALHEAEARIIETWVADGGDYTSKTVQIHHSIQGAYKPGEHPTEAAVKVTAGKRLRAAVKKTVLQETSAHDQIVIKFVIDMGTCRFNETVTEYGIFKIAGCNLKIAGTDPSVGIEFLSFENSSVYKVDSKLIVLNSPSELVFTAPWMAVDEEVEVRVTTQYTSGGKLLKTPRSITFNKTLIVLPNKFAHKPV